MVTQEELEDRANTGLDPSGYTFREAGEHDFPGIEKLFESRRMGPGWAVWKYRKSPDGCARVFVAEGPNKTIVGTLAYLPRRFAIADSGSLTVMQAVDIFLTAELRTQYVFLGLLEFVRKHIDGPRIGLPNDSSEVFGSGLGWHVLGPYEAWRFPVSIGGLFAGKPLTIIAPVANVLSRIYVSCWLPGNPRNLKMCRVTRFSRDYALDSAAIHGVRSADYLNWRFVENPVSEYFAYEFLEGDESVGYCVFTLVGSSAILFDFVTVRRHRNCLRLLVEHCRTNTIASISMSGTGLQLRKLGFMRRRRSDHKCTACKVPEGQWIITPCDSDSEPGRTLLDIT